MGAAGSSQRHLNAEELYRLQKRHGNLTIAEIELCSSRYSHILSKAELSGLIERLQNDWLLKRMFEVLFPESMDDGPAAVTLDRFLDAFSDWKGAGIEHKLGVVFQMLDADGKEVLTVHDFTSFLANLGRYKPYVGDTMRVKADGRAGILRFVGPTKFENGIWAGLELPSAVGKNDGSVAGVRYFQCEPKRGVFIPVDQVQLLRHYEASCEIMKHFSSVNVEKVILSSDEFVEKMKADPWIVSLFDKILVSQDR